ncbi:MAG: chemotaxis protein CheC [Elusimicrobia bacterium]|nr:chemotaxis protein CheC [Candidatus Obscuribacterium magneticum]
MQIPEKLKDINRDAAEQASLALSKLTGTAVQVQIERAEIERQETVCPPALSEELVVGVCLPVTGDAKGTALLAIAQETAFQLCDVMMRRPPHTTRLLTPLDESALKEAGNILVGNYLSVMADRLEMKTVEGLPYLATGMLGSLLSQIVAKTVITASETLLVNVEFLVASAHFKGVMILVFMAEQMEAIFRALENV